MIGIENLLYVVEFVQKTSIMNLLSCKSEKFLFETVEDALVSNLFFKRKNSGEYRGKPDGHKRNRRSIADS